MSPARHVCGAAAVVALALWPRLIVAPGALDAFAAAAAADTAEHFACLLGRRVGNAFVVTGTRGTSVDYSLSTRYRVVRVQGCQAGAIGFMHAHPDGDRCWYYFPTTVVPTSDANAASKSPYALDVIYCRGQLVWFHAGVEHGVGPR